MGSKKKIDSVLILFFLRSFREASTRRETNFMKFRKIDKAFLDHCGQSANGEFLFYKIGLDLPTMLSICADDPTCFAINYIHESKEAFFCKIQEHETYYGGCGVKSTHYYKVKPGDLDKINDGIVANFKRNNKIDISELII